jgi:outer membrane protein assembly factor BamE (lipoprotein component of BamABCDE complex)
MLPVIPLFPSTQSVRLSSFRIFALAIVAASLLVAVSSATAQTRKPATSASSEDESVLYRDYRGVQLGMTSDEVRKKLGDPKDKSDEQDFFVFNDNETAQIVYDKTHKVITISADYLSAGDKVPTAKQVFTGDVETKADGSMYKMVRLLKAGYWLSYNRTGGASPLTTVTLQKIQ